MRRAKLAVLVCAALCGSRAIASGPLDFGIQQPLYPGAVLSYSEIDGPVAAGDGAGNWVAVYWGADVSRSSDHGVTWTAAVPIDPMNDNQRTALATDRAGIWVAAWYAIGIPAYYDGDLVFARSLDAGATWTPAAPLDTDALTDTRFDTDVELATDGNVWVAVWSGTEPGGDAEILFARSVDGGATWSPPAALNTDAGSDTDADAIPSIATDGTTWVVAWKSGSSLVTASSTDDGSTWSAPTMLTASPAVEVHITAVPGTFVAAWTDCCTVTAVRSIDAGATWGSATLLATDPLEQINNQVRLAAQQGRVVAVWASGSDLGGTGGDDLNFAITDDGGITWSPRRALNSAAPKDSGVYDVNPYLAIDGAGHWIALWASGSDLNDLTFMRARSIPEPGCSAAALAGCRVAPGGASSLKILDGPGDGDQLKWKWRGDATVLDDFGDPQNDVSYALCAYDGGTLSVAALMHGGVCGNRLCWTARATGWRYRDGARLPDGIGKANLLTKPGNEARLVLKATGAGLLDAPVLPAGLPVVVQLQATSGECWEATYGATKRNDSAGLVAVSD